MKFYPSVTKNEIPENDRKAWYHLSNLMKVEPEKGDAKEVVFETFIKQLEQKYPTLPTEMVWGNYLISETFENRVSLSIDYEDKDEMIADIVQIAKQNNLVVFDPATEKIHRP